MTCKANKIYFLCQIKLTIGERPNKKHIEALDLTRKRKSVNVDDVENEIILQNYSSVYSVI